MDEIVLAALDKWPNVPHCYGWLALDARGVWRMRDERCQALNLPGDQVRNATLLGFINRNYLHDQQGRWYFQNGPQRVYVKLEATPYIVRSSPDLGLLLHTGVAMTEINQVFLSSDGQLILRAGQILALLDDRDLANCLQDLRLNGKPASDEELMTWLEQIPGAVDTDSLSLILTTTEAREYPIRHGELNQLMHDLGYVHIPKAD